MLTFRDILWGIGAPAVLAAVFVLLAHAPRARRRERDAQPWGATLAIVAAFATAFVAIAGRPAIPPVTAEGWLPYLAVPVAILGVIATVAAGRRGRAGAAAASVILLLLTAFLLGGPKRQSAEPREAWTLIAIAAATMLAWWAAMEPLARRLRGPTLPLLLSATAGVTALVLVDTGTQTLGQIAGAVSVALGTIALLALVRLRNLTLARGGVLAVAVLVLGLILVGETHFYGYMEPSHAFLLAAAPLAAWLGQLVPARKRKLRFAVAALAVLGVLSIPLVPAVRGLHKTMTEQTESYVY